MFRSLSGSVRFRIHEFFHLTYPDYRHGGSTDILIHTAELSPGRIGNNKTLRVCPSRAICCHDGGFPGPLVRRQLYAADTLRH
ncbi:hypothetical protein F2P81_022657 [Scophthalmus maximus]|uniref:Uncharacterized protein n=1 Tax=Scophthalmus maximus TaxID=52904 RepID=A0A6A4RSX9_SCOMX|nr:hypothetical protein F2P81_022657 [Scophthalmus maximus]